MYDGIASRPGEALTHRFRPRSYSQTARECCLLTVGLVELRRASPRPFGCQWGAVKRMGCALLSPSYGLRTVARQCGWASDIRVGGSSSAYLRLLLRISVSVISMKLYWGM